MGKIISVLNCTPHVLSQCNSCGWNEAVSLGTEKARAQLFKHMRQNGCTDGRIEVGRVSHYRQLKS